MYGDFDSDAKIREKWTKSRVEFLHWSDAGISVVEDLQESTARFEYNRDRAEWALWVRSTYKPFIPLGVLVITLKDNGDIVLTIE